MSIPYQAAEGAPVLVEQADRVLIITINRPKAGNSISLEVADAIVRALGNQQHQREEILCVIVTGAGDRFFCTGGDLKAYQALQTPAQLRRAFGKVRKLLDVIEAFRLPVIAAINGYALGGGVDFALACDLRIATVGAQIGFAQANLGLISGWNGIERLVEAVGRSTAMRLLLTGERLSAQDAQALGLVDIVSEGSALAEALRFSKRLQEVGPLTLGAAKTAVLAALQRSAKDARRISSDLFEKLWFSEDHREAERAFLEKRRPNFRRR